MSSSEKSRWLAIEILKKIRANGLRVRCANINFTHDSLPGMQARIIAGTIFPRVRFEDEV